MFHPNHIKSFVFDLQSISDETSEKNLQNFLQFLNVLHDRDYKILLAHTNPNFKISFPRKYTFLKGNAKLILAENSSLQNKDVFWVSDDVDFHSSLEKQSLYFAGSVDSVRECGGIQYQTLYELLAIFHPSQNTAIELAEEIETLKAKSPQMPLTLGIGGPDECGHAFFSGELLEALEDKALLVAGLDLTELMGHEFQSKVAPDHYWCSTEIREWIMQEILIPYSQGKTVFVEQAPSCLEAYECANFPFFLPPEGILILWGTTPFIPELQSLLDVRILLELQTKTAAARLLKLDEREDFDPAFIETYEQAEGKRYQKYLKDFEVEDEIDYFVDFNNFHAFRIR